MSKRTPAMLKTDVDQYALSVGFQGKADRGQAPVYQGAHASPFPPPKPLAAWTQRACPQIDHSCFQSNRARKASGFGCSPFNRASASPPSKGDFRRSACKRSRDRQGANAKPRKHETGGSNSGQALRIRRWTVIFDGADSFGAATVRKRTQNPIFLFNPPVFQLLSDLPVRKPRP